jgi:hypothetical protein
VLTRGRGLLCRVNNLDSLASRRGHYSSLDNASLGSAAALRDAGLRLTASRLAVPTTLAASAPHASADNWGQAELLDCRATNVTSGEL